MNSRLRTRVGALVGLLAVAFTRLCSVDDLQPGQMESFFVEGWEVLITRDKQGELHAMDGICPHEDFPLVEGSFDGQVITCSGHRWMFDGTNGRGVNPANCQIPQYELKIEGDDVLVDLPVVD